MEIYSEKVFLEELKISIERLNLNEELCRENNSSDFLYKCYLFVKELEENNINYSLHHIHDNSSVLSILLGYDSAERISGSFSFKTYFNSDDVAPTFTVCVATNKKEEVVSILNNIVDIDYEHSSYNAYYFGNNHQYHINILSSPYIDRLDNLEELTGLDNDDIPLRDIETVNYMLELDDKGYYMPHLYGCFLGGVKHLYQMMEIIKPTNLFDLVKLECLNRAQYKDFSLVKESLKTSGLEFTLYSREQLNHLLINIYDIPIKDALFIVQCVSHGKELLDYQKETLTSYEVPEYIVKQFDNIQYLPYLIYDYFKMLLVYLLAYYKKHYPEQFLQVLEVPYKDSYVGPFFYINNKLYGHMEKMINYSPNNRFFDNDISHFNYFKTLPIKGDYGHYPRGRIIFDNYSKKFIVYIDNVLAKKIIRDTIIKKYCLPKERTIFKYDEHYTHDEL